MQRHQPNLRQQFLTVMKAALLMLLASSSGFAQFAETPPAPPAPPTPPSATIQVPGQQQYSPTPVIMMNPSAGASGAAGAIGTPSIFIVPTPSPITPQQQTNGSSQPSILLPAGTRILLSLQREIRPRSAHIGDAVYLRSRFPVVVQGSVAVPAGAYMQGSIDQVLSSSKLRPHTRIRVRLALLILANGPVIQLTAPARTVAYANLASKTSNSVISRGTTVEVTLPWPIALPNGTPALSSSPTSSTSPATIPVYIPFSASQQIQQQTMGNSANTPPSAPTRYIK